MEIGEIREILQTIAQSTLATTSAAEAMKKAVEDKKTKTTDWSKLIAKPNIFDYVTRRRDQGVQKVVMGH